LRFGQGKSGDGHDDAAEACPVAFFLYLSMSTVYLKMDDSTFSAKY